MDQAREGERDAPAEADAREEVLLKQSAYGTRELEGDPHDDEEGDEVAERDTYRAVAHVGLEDGRESLRQRAEDRQDARDADRPEDAGQQVEHVLQAALEPRAVLLHGAQEAKRAHAQRPGDERVRDPHQRPQPTPHCAAPISVNSMARARRGYPPMPADEGLTQASASHRRFSRRRRRSSSISPDVRRRRGTERRHERATCASSLLDERDRDDQERTQIDRRAVPTTRSPARTPGA